MPKSSTEIPTPKEISKKRKKKIFFSVCVQINNAKDSNKLKGVAARKKFLSKNNISPNASFVKESLAFKFKPRLENSKNDTVNNFDFFIKFSFFK